MRNFRHFTRVRSNGGDIGRRFEDGLSRSPGVVRNFSLHINRRNQRAAVRQFLATFHRARPSPWLAQKGRSFHSKIACLRRCHI